MTAETNGASPYGMGLLPQHAALIDASAISPEVAMERGYVSAETKAELKRRGFGVTQANVPALLIPLRDVRGELAGYLARPDQPRVKDGGPLKYEAPGKQRSVLDVPPRVLPHIGNPNRPLLIAEGVRKADAAVTAGLDCLAILGVWNWRGSNDDDGLTALAAWELVALNGRQIYIVFDSDIAVKISVHRALGRLKRFLEFRHANVAVIYLPAGEAGTKVGLDDYLAAGHSTDQLLALAQTELREPDRKGPTTGPEEPPPAPCTLSAVIAAFTRWLRLDDIIPLLAVLGVYAANQLAGDPVWLMLVGGSGRGKTEIITSLVRCPDVRCAASVTEAALLSGVARKDHAEGAKGGLLAEIGDHGTLILKDFTSIISMNRDQRAATLSALREVFDGRWDRAVGTDGGRVLTWSGKLAVVAGCTTVIDSAHAVTSSMGDRFLTCRIGEGDAENRDNLARRSLAQAGREVEMRSELTAAVAGLFANGLPQPAYQLDDETRRRLVALVGFVAQARSPVTRDYQGEVDLILDSEAPTRIAKSLERLHAGLGAIGLSRPDAWEVVARVGLDCIPKLRRAVIDVVKKGGQPSTRDIAVAVNHPTKTTHRALEDLEAHHVLNRERGGGNQGDLWAMTAWATESLTICEPETSVSGKTVVSHSPSDEGDSLIHTQHVQTDNSGSQIPEPPRQRVAL